VDAAVVATLDFTMPRVLSVPDGGDFELGRQAVELAAEFGLILDPWQAWTLEQAMALREEERLWAAFEVGICAPRQNGKDGILEARELAGLFLDELEENLLIHSAHLFATSREHFSRLVGLVEGSEEYSRKVRRIRRSHGEEGIELMNGKRIRFFTRMKGSARGFSCDCLLWNEAMILTEAARGAMMPTVSAMPNPQVWYAGSAVDQLVHEHGVVFASVRERGLAGDDPSLAWFEWSADTDRTPDDLGVLAGDPAAVAQANPALGIRIKPEHVENERRSMAARTYAVERLGVGDWPRTDGLAAMIISPEAWADLLEADSKIHDPVCLAYDIAPDRSMAAIAAAGRNQDGLFHVEIVEHRRGTGWVAERFRQLIDRWDPAWKGCDSFAMLAALEEDGLFTVNAAEHGKACGRFVDAVEQQTFRHLGSDELRSAVRGARTRPLSDAGWAWSRKGSPVDITPLVAATLALSAAMDQELGEVEIF
jgi:hypothetical protein